MLEINYKIGGGKIGAPDSQKEKYGALDGLRALACIGIVLMHVKSNIVIKPTDGWFVENVISFTGNFVLLFMMVSAFSLSCGYFERFKEGTVNLDAFYRKRYKRVFPFFALLVGIDVLQTFVAQGGQLSAVMRAELYEAYADLTLAFGFMPDADITVIGVGWFLGVIFIFYMLYPFFTFLLYTKRRAWMAFILVVILYFCVCWYFIPAKGVVSGRANMLICAPYFLTGGILYLYRTAISSFASRSYKGCPYGAGILFSVLLYTVAFFVFPVVRSLPLSSLLLYALWVVYAVAGCGTGVLDNRFTHFISGISMEIYLCHMMFFRVVEKLHIERWIQDNDLHYWIVCMGVLSAAVCFSCVWKRIEKRYLI